MGAMRLIRVSACGLALLCLTFLLVAPRARAQDKPAVSTVILSEDGLAQVTIPEGWQKQLDLHQEAELQVANPRRDLYVIVLSEAKMDFDNITFEEHSQFTREPLMKNLGNSKIESGPKQLTINERPAIQYEISGVLDKIRVRYIHTTVDGETKFHQVLAWSLPSNYEKYHHELEAVINSFKENPKQ
jgi:hypothetical protein